MMVQIVAFMRKIFGSRSKGTSSTVSKQMELPPPEYVSVCTGSHAPVLVEKTATTTTTRGDTQFLNPNLAFTASEIEAQLISKDTKFAAAVVELMVPRLKLGVWQEPVGWGHYSYTLDKVSRTWSKLTL